MENIKKYRKVIKEFIPPLILRAIQNKNKKYGFFGNYSSWSDAQKKTTGYNSDNILEKVKAGALKVKNNEALYERDGIIFDKIDYSWPLLAHLLWIASKNNGRLNLIDFGGSLGTTYFQNKNYFENLKELKWNIVEQKNFADCGKELFEDNNLKFFYTIEDCLSKENSKIILISSVLQYLYNPYEFLEKIINLNFDYIIFDRTTFIKNDDRITIQKVPPKIYDASYPCWLFNQAKFLKILKRNYKLIAEFDAHIGTKILLKDTTATYKGFCFKKIK
ncbi:methyltransferase, TIGR04325 family [Patescibacteria group bacterium]|nr:methyltransferase, TIGR04325 family [Candidatus Falkowbacteria bacterium]MBU3906162.1 methyltransferase, TIGR04325 family [Patescibacteria group bacterium]MCG2697508.1 TIGR04325 family methyltransferase [Candidatus Parcubacteria bacterium]MBU4014982.1 methyltransferase, TIGR04325 family [Patescibacteria group bacterium]MBU4026655.1 methyltransferase, TIGR04325 family [Patescibacteria group bacterium]